jgi:hypothetical protein
VAHDLAPRRSEQQWQIMQGAKAARCQNIENNPMQSNRPPAAGSWQPEKQLDPSGKSPAYLHHSEIL